MERYQGSTKTTRRPATVLASWCASVSFTHAPVVSAASVAIRQPKLGGNLEADT